MASPLKRIGRRWQARNAPIRLPDIPGVDPHAPALRNLDSQIEWYDRNARRTMAWHFRLRGAQIILAAAIPVTQIIPAAVGWRIVAGVCGGLIAVCQGFDSMHHYADHYVAWRATTQQLLRERQLFSAHAGDYKGLSPEDSLRTLATRADEIEAQEQQRWASGQKNSAATGAPTQ